MRAPPNLRFHDLAPPPADFLAAVLAGLSRRPKCLSPVFLYDAAGSRLFDAITRLPEYYPTRAEIGLLRRHAREMAALIGRDAQLLELGSGNGVKVRLLLDELKPRAYLPIDISRAHLYRAARAIAREHPKLAVHALCADYLRELTLPDAPAARRVAFFPGSSIGNLEPEDARGLLARLARLVGPDGRLIIGVDLKKAPALLNAAYNDRQGVTAAFNRNLLTRINRELAADFDPAAFRHHAFYDPARGRVEMHLAAGSPQRVAIDGHRFRFTAGESIHTENSYKYSVAEFGALAAAAGLEHERVWQDAAGLFSIHCLRPA